jgi:hypothetical protein
MGKSDDCYIDVWREKNFEGEMIRLNGPAEYANLEFAQGDWGDDIGSLRVGPNAFVLVYRDKDFQNSMISFGPLDSIANLRELKFNDEIDSVRVIDSLKIFDRVTYNEARNQAIREDEAQQKKDKRNRKRDR